MVLLVLTRYQSREGSSMQNQPNKNVFDSKTIIVMVSVALVYFGWQSYLGKKYPDYNKPKSTNVSTDTSKSLDKNTSANQTVVESVHSQVAPSDLSTVEKTISFASEKVSFDITSQGMGLKNFTVNQYQDKEKNKIKLGLSDSQSLFSMHLNSIPGPLNFDVVQESPGNFVGIAKVGGMTIKRELKFNSETSSFKSTITINNPTEDVKKGVSILIPEKIQASQSKSFLFPSYSHQDFFIGHSSKTESMNFSSAKEDFEKIFENTKLISVGSQYFTALVFDQSAISPEVKVSAEVASKTALAELTYKPVQLANEMSFAEVFYAGPKAIDVLKSVDPELAGVIDLGFFEMIGQPLLYIMKAFHGWVGNWGFAIIMLTLMVRFCVLPFNLMSAKSMKAMQKAQPAIQALRDKHKDDPMRLNQEMMSTMKQHGANPMGGCLPMLIQIPVFFALYRVIGSSVELYNSPFVGWIHDLSAHDPFYVLPILMSVFMFIQQKITPSTMDPAQAKIMLFLPLVFSVFMLQLPAGLTLYMVVSTLFGIIQQYFIMRDAKVSRA